MQQNILKESNVTKIYLIFTDNGLKKKRSVKIKFMEAKKFYLSTPLPPNFNKPKRKTPAELVVYTTDGVYKATVSILDSSMSLNDLLYEVSAPQKWDYIQLRASSRKKAELPVKIKFNDGFVIETKTYDLSLGGLSFASKETLSAIYKKVPCIMTIELPRETLINFPDGKLIKEAKFVREKPVSEDYNADTLFIFKFASKLSYEEESILKQFLLKLN